MEIKWLLIIIGILTVELILAIGVAVYLWTQCPKEKKRRGLALLCAILCVESLVFFCQAPQVARLVQSDRIHRAEITTKGDELFFLIYSQLELQGEDALSMLESMIQASGGLDGVVTNFDPYSIGSPIMDQYWVPEYLSGIKAILRGASGTVAVLSAGGVWFFLRKKAEEDT